MAKFKAGDLLKIKDVDYLLNVERIDGNDLYCGNGLILSGPHIEMRRATDKDIINFLDKRLEFDLEYDYE